MAFIGDKTPGDYPPESREVDYIGDRLNEGLFQFPGQQNKMLSDHDATDNGTHRGIAPPPYYPGYRVSNTRDSRTVDHRIDMKLPPTMPKTESSTFSPSIHIVIQIVGLRDDVRTFLALGIVLKSYGHRVRIATHPVFRTLVTSYGLDFFDIGGDPEVIMAQMLQCSGLFSTAGDLASGRAQDLRRTIQDVMNTCWRSCFDNTSQEAHLEPFVTDLIIANPSSHAHIHCAQKLGIPVHLVSTAPSSSLQAHVKPLTSVKPDLNSSVPNYSSTVLMDLAVWQVFGHTVNSFRRKTLILDTMDLIWIQCIIARLKIPHTYCWSPLLLPKPEACPSHIAISGYCFLPQAGIAYTPPPALAEFLSAGEAPLYINFGPVMLSDSTVLENLVFEAVRLAGVRAVVCLGHDCPGASSTMSVNQNVFLVDDVSREWILPKVSCVVHCGSPEVTAAALRIGKPSIIVPFFGDQSFWGDIVAHSGASPKPIPFGQLTSTKLAQAIHEALQPAYLNTLRAISEHIANEDGAKVASEFIISQLPLSKLRCSISDDRICVWKHKRYPNIKLSALAAAVLEDEGLLSMSNLSLARGIKFDLDSGPREPISGGASAIAGLFFDTFHGIGEIGYDIASTFGTIHHLSNSLSDRQPRDSDAENPPVAKAETKMTIPGYRSLKGSSRIFKAAARAPMTFTYALAQGSHNMPYLWGDRLIRPQQEITGIWSGLTAGVKELILGTYDGVAGLIEQPIVGAKREGAKGFAKGICHGILGLPTRWFAAMSGTVGYPLKGVDAQIVRLVRKDPLDEVIAARTEQGRFQLQSVSLVERHAIVDKWKAIVAEAGGK